VCVCVKLTSRLTVTNNRVLREYLDLSDKRLEKNEKRGKRDERGCSTHEGD
jgi:hypothetical protein